jgi:hypothetical protein
VKPFASAQAQFMIKGIFSLSGVCDVVAFKYARSGLLLFGSTAEEASAESEPVAPEVDEISLHSINDSVNSGGPPKARKHGPLKKHWKFLGANSTARRWPYSTDISKVSWLVVNALDAAWVTFCLWIPSMIFLTGP